jgi:hypothetical protein
MLTFRGARKAREPGMAKKRFAAALTADQVQLSAQ